MECEGRDDFAEVAQLIEHQPSKLRVASLSLVFRSQFGGGRAVDLHRIEKEKWRVNLATQ